MQLSSETDLDLFELRAELRGSHGRYQCRVTLPDGATLSGSFQLRIDPYDVLALRQSSVSRAGGQKGADPAQRLGAQLFDALFGRRLGLHYKSALRASSDRGKGFRLRLVLPIDDEVADLPWELLYDREFRSDYVALGQGTAVVREVLDTDVPPFEPVDGALRVLIASFNDRSMLPIDVDREVAIIRRATERFAEIEHIHRPDRQQLLDRIADGPWHVVHYVGTGAPTMKPREPQSIIVGSPEPDKWDQILDEDLAAALGEVSGLRLVILNACKTDRVAARVATRVPAAMGLLGDITDPSAISLAANLYGQIGQGAHLEQALAAARRVVDFERPGTLDWSAPVLYLRGGGQPLVRPTAPSEASGNGDGNAPPTASPGPPSGAPEDEEHAYLAARLDVDRQNLAALEASATQFADAIPTGIAEELDRLRQRVADTETALGLQTEP